MKRLQAEVHKKLSNVHMTIWMSLGRRSPPPPPLRCWQAPFCSVWSDFWTLVSEIDAGSLSKWWCSTVLVSSSSSSETLSTLLLLNSYHNCFAKGMTQKPWKVKRNLSKASATPRLKTFLNRHTHYFTTNLWRKIKTVITVRFIKLTRTPPQDHLFKSRGPLNAFICDASKHKRNLKAINCNPNKISNNKYMLVKIIFLSLFTLCLLLKHCI